MRAVSRTSDHNHAKQAVFHQSKGWHSTLYFPYIDAFCEFYMMTESFLSALTDLLFEESDQFIGIYDPLNRQFVRVNRAGAELFGYASEDAFLRERVDQLRRQPLTVQQWEELKARIEREGQWVEEAELVRKGGQPVRARIFINIFRPESQTFYLVRISSLEHTRTMETMERELEHSSRRYGAVFTNATIGIIVSDSRGKIVSASNYTQLQFGYAEEELIGQAIEILVPESISNVHRKHRQAFNAHPQVRSMGHGRDLYARRKDGSVFPAEISLSYFHQDDELYVVAYVIDITYKKESERVLIEQKNRIEQLNAELEEKVADRTHALMATLHQLEHSKDELAKALAAERELGELKSRFVSMASHEFRTPLSAILTSSQLLEKYTTTEQQDKRDRHIHRIKSSVNHLNDILEEFLSVGKLEEGKVEAMLTYFNLGELIQDVVADIQGMLKPGQSIEVETDCPMHVRLDKSLVRKILVNLISNAVKYSGEHVPITVRGWCRGGHTKITIQDRGIGISEEDQKHLFERFFRAKNATNFAGTGLGLHIVAKYLELLNGTIDLRSQLNEGTTVTISFLHENHPAY